MATKGPPTPPPAATKRPPTQTKAKVKAQTKVKGQTKAQTKVKAQTKAFFDELRIQSFAEEGVLGLAPRAFPFEAVLASRENALENAARE